MPLQPIHLDDLTWSDLTKATRDRIASVSRGEWTLHSPVDPGITILELFAAQLEQRLYWMDQTVRRPYIGLVEAAGRGPSTGWNCVKPFCTFVIPIRPPTPTPVLFGGHSHESAGQ